MNHRCAVCWDTQQDHEDWYAHCRAAHDANLDDFGYSRCIGNNGDQCPGVIHRRRLAREGDPPVRRAKDLGQPVAARDGTVYTPIPLFEERPTG